MRRYLAVLFPITVVSVLIQLLAPMIAFSLAASATADPLYLSSICEGMASFAGSQGTLDPTPPAAAKTWPANTQHDRGHCCAFCAFWHAGAIPVAPPQTFFVSLQRVYQSYSWLESSDGLPAARVGSNAQARAPPTS